MTIVNYDGYKAYDVFTDQYANTGLCNHNQIVFEEMSSGDEEDILDQIYKKKTCSDFYDNDLKFYNIIRKYRPTLKKP